MRISTFIIAVLSTALASSAGEKELTLDQELLLACYRVDIEGVVRALREGANVNATLKNFDRKKFLDKWDYRHVGTTGSTPLHMLAQSSPYPDPLHKIEHSVKGSIQANKEQQAIPKEVLEARDNDVITILYILLSHKCKVDNQSDGFGSPLYFAINRRKEQMAIVLLNFGAECNVSYDRNIDGVNNITPLHEAYWSENLTRILLKKGANKEAKDTEGKTPFDYAKRGGDISVIKLYEEK